MKLYTEEQVREAARGEGWTENVNEIVDRLTPIELPTDEDIEKYIEKTFYGVKKHYFKAGVEFMKELINKKNNI